MSTAEIIVCALFLVICWNIAVAVTALVIGLMVEEARECWGDFKKWRNKP